MILNPFNDFFYTYNLKIKKQELDQINILISQSEKLKININENHLSTFIPVNNLVLNILNFPVLKNLKKQIITILDKHKLFLRNSWIQKYVKNQKHQKHTHLHSAYSGIIYVNGDEKSGSTIFYHPLKDKLISEYDVNFIEIYEQKFEINKLILFPSYIVHEVLEEKENYNRTIISFNSNFKS